MYLQNILISCPNTDTNLPITTIGNGKPVLLLHAFGMDAREFIPFIAPLSTRYQFYLPHFRGFGLAQNIQLTQFDFIEQYASDTRAVIEHICSQHRLPCIPVAAISMGALVMWAYFNRYAADKICRYLNIDQAPIIHNQPDWQGGLFGDKQGEVFAQFQNVLDNAQPYQTQIKDFTHLPYRTKQIIREMEWQFSCLSTARKHSRLFIKALRYQAPHKRIFSQHPTWQHKLHCLSAYLQLPYDYRSALANIDVPVTLLIGARSKLYAASWQSKLAEYLDHVNEVILPNSGHAVPLDAPAGFYQTLKRFLDNKSSK